MRKIVRDNGLTAVLLIAFAFSTVGMLLAGFNSFNEELVEHGQKPEALSAYLVSGDFLSALFENWESEFLQMSAYVILTAFLFQRGSAESRNPEDPDRPNDEPTPGIFGWLYAYSLGFILAALFLISFALHWFFSWTAASEIANFHGRSPKYFLAYLFDWQFWFESFQNWQSEFLSTAVLVVLSIFLRHRGSPESKPVRARNSETGA